MAEVACKHCGRIFSCKPSKALIRKYCSSECYGKSQYLNLPPLSKRQMEIIVGSLLGDGCIQMPSTGRSGVRQGNSVFSETHSVKYDEFCQWLAMELGEWHSKNSLHVPRDDVHHSTISVRSKSHPFWNELREKWYPQGKKEVPKDLVLTPLMLANWYGGDGSYSPKGGCRIATCGFLCDDVGFLVNRLKIDLGIDSYVRVEKGRGGYADSVYPIICFRSSECERLREVIYPHFVWKCYQHKISFVTKKWHTMKVWKFIDPQGVQHQTEHLKSFCLRFDLNYGKMSNVARGTRPHHKGWKSICEVCK